MDDAIGVDEAEGPEPREIRNEKLHRRQERAMTLLTVVMSKAKSWGSTMDGGGPETKKGKEERGELRLLLLPSSPVHTGNEDSQAHRGQGYIFGDLNLTKTALIGRRSCSANGGEREKVSSSSSPSPSSFLYLSLSHPPSFP